MLKDSQVDLCGRTDFTRTAPLLARDEAFSFACAGCGGCCRGREDIVLSGFDLWRIAARLRLPPHTVARAFCRGSIGRVSRLPVLRLAPLKEERGNCPFLTGNHCAIHDAEPLVCALYPLAQEITKDGQVSYFLQPTQCGGQVIAARVGDYLARYDVPAREAADVRWAQVCMELEDTVERLDALFEPVFARRMQESGIVDAVGLNCVSAPGAMRTLAKQLGGTLPLSVMPNAGYPVVTRTQVKYQGRPEYFARELGRLAAEGTVQILGGCCGTTPAHIAALRAELDSLPVVEKTAPAEEFSTAKEQTVENEDAFLRKLNAGEKVIAIELDSPRNADLTGYLEGAKKLQAAGADLLTIADCPIAQARMDSSLVACRVHRELGLCTLPHMTCRDRNLNATKALLLGLYAEGVREVLAITGDPIPTAERDEVKNVYQFNSRKLAQYIVSLAGEGREMPGPMTVFGALNLNARNFDVELRRAKEKLENGMSGFLTQPVLSAQAVENLKKSRETLGADAKILTGIMPVVSQRNAIFMENEINGIHVEDWIIEKFAGLDRAQGEELGLAISLEMAKAALPYADGLYLMTPFNRVALMERLIGRLKQEVLGAY